MGSKSKSANGNLAVAIGKGVILALVISVISASVYALLIHRQTVPEKSFGTWLYTSLALASLLGCLASSRIIEGKRIIVCAITAAAYAFVLLATGVLFFDGAMRGLGGRLVAILIGAVISWLLSMKKPGNKVKIKRRPR